MLLDLRVKNLALIEKAEVSFSQGLNILTGETGAGKSIIIGSINMALGGKASKDVIRPGAEYAYIELIFSVDTPEKAESLREFDVEIPEDNTLIISRKIMPSRSISKVNDETVTAGRLRDITGLLLDIHGQHEHQSLLYRSKHLEILDSYAKDKTVPLKRSVSEVYHRYQDLTERLGSLEGDAESRLREADFLRYEIDELEQSHLKEGEEEELTARYRLLSHAQRIIEWLSGAYSVLDGEEIGNALKDVTQAAQYDEDLNGIRDQLADAESILNDAARDIDIYMDDFSFDEEEFARIEKRLDQIHSLMAKYGGSIGEINEQLESKKARLDELENYDLIKEQTEEKYRACREELDEYCEELSAVRKEAAETLTDEIRKGLVDLNFNDVRFEMEFRRLDNYTANGYDEAEFMISTNPGLPLRPLANVASGGELSRIMLAIKAVLADTDDIPTLIFDEIDTGISGRTAQKVSEKLHLIAKNHQVICITHLPQIAAMADTHFEISKDVVDGNTVTYIRKLDEDEMIEELARLLGGAKITDAVRDNAREMKQLAKS